MQPPVEKEGAESVELVPSGEKYSPLASVRAGDAAGKVSYISLRLRDKTSSITLKNSSLMSEES